MTNAGHLCCVTWPDAVYTASRLLKCRMHASCVTFSLTTCLNFRIMRIPRSFIVGLSLACVFLSAQASYPAAEWTYSQTKALLSRREGFTRTSTATCDVLECPPYSVVHEEADFEIRRYHNATWAETEPLQDVSFMKATYRGFHSLFQYIEGENEDAAHIPMTAPVLTSIVPSAGPFCSSAFVLRLYVPSQFAANPPPPKKSLNPPLKVALMGSHCVAIRRFGGFASDFNVAEEASGLAQSLEKSVWADVISQASADGGEAYTIAQYNSPFEISGRVNEVWVRFGVEGPNAESCLPEQAHPKSM